jgi:hypothetical protein
MYYEYDARAVEPISAVYSYLNQGFVKGVNKERKKEK